MCKNILQVSFYCFFTACSTDPHFDPDTADNTKQWNRTHHEKIPLVFGSVEKTLKMKSFIFSKMGHPHITIAMLGPSLMRSCQTSGLDKEVLLNILPVHKTSHH